jgi:hypothetical protein
VVKVLARCDRSRISGNHSTKLGSLIDFETDLRRTSDPCRMN